MKLTDDVNNNMSAKSLAIRSFSSSGLAALVRRLFVRDGRFVLAFHGVSSHRFLDIPADLQPHHSIGEFHQVLAWLSSRFEFLTVDEFLTGQRPGVLLTFDDGYANNFTNVLPQLSEFHAQGLFFVAAQHVVDPQDWLSFTRMDAVRLWGDQQAVPGEFARDCYDGLSADQLAELASSPLAVIGSHTVSHPSLPSCSSADLHHQLVDSKEYLQSLISRPVEYFAYPYGDYTRRVAEAVRAAGYRAAFAVDPIPVGLPAYEIPRIGIYSASSEYLDLKLSGLHRRPVRQPVIVSFP